MASLAKIVTESTTCGGGAKTPNAPKAYSYGVVKGSRSGVLTENSSGSVITGETGLAHTRAALVSAIEVQEI